MAQRGLWGDVPDTPGGLFGDWSGMARGARDTVMSPLFLGGAALLGGEGMSGAIRGMQAGGQFQQQQRENQQQDEARAAMADGVFQSPTFAGMSIAEKDMLARNPQMAQQVLGQVYQHRFDPLAKLKEEQIRGDLALNPYKIDLTKAQAAQAYATAASADQNWAMDSSSGMLFNKRTGEVKRPDTGQTGVMLKDKDKVQAEAELRKEFASNAKPYFEVRDAYSRILQSAQKPSPASDISLIYNFMKMLDPGSVVREGEFATAQNAGSIDQRVTAMYNRVLSGQRLTDETRNDFVNQAHGLHARSANQYQRIQQQYQGIASRSGVDPNNTIIDYGPPQTADQQRAAPKGQPALPQGWSIQEVK